MLIRIAVKNEQGQVIPAKLQIIGGQGYGNFTSGISTNGFSLDTDEFAGLTDPSTQIIFSSPGYNSLAITGNALQPENDVVLLKSNTTALLLAGAIVATGLLYNGSKRKKRVRGFNDLSPATKNIVVLAGVGLAAYLIIKGGKPPGSQLPVLADKMLQELAAKGIYPTITAAQAESFSGALRTAFNDCGTDENAVFAVMNRMLNDADIWTLVKQYGVRAYKGCFNESDWFTEHEWNLSEAMASELSGSDIATINSSFEAKGMSFKF